MYFNFCICRKYLKPVMMMLTCFHCLSQFLSFSYCLILIIKNEKFEARKKKSADKKKKKKKKNVSELFCKQKPSVGFSLLVKHKMGQLC